MHPYSAAQEVRWFLATDSLALRRQACDAYGDKLVTAINAPVAHTRAAHARMDNRKMASAQRKAQRRGLHTFQDLEDDDRLLSWNNCICLLYDG